MKRMIKYIALILCLALCLISFAGCTTTDEYHDGKLCGTWEVETWVSLSRCYYPVYYTLRLASDGSAQQWIDEEQFKYNLQLEETFSFIIYPLMENANYRNQFIGMSQDKYNEYLRTMIANKLPARIEEVYGKTMEQWLDDEYAKYKALVDKGETDAGTTYWISNGGKVAFLAYTTDFDGKTSEEIWTQLNTDNPYGCIAYSFSDGNELVTLSQISDDPDRNSYPVTMLKIG